MDNGKEQSSQNDNQRDIHAVTVPERREKQHQSGKLTAMERICLLLDPNSFVEIDGLWATDPGASSLGNRAVR